MFFLKHRKLTDEQRESHIRDRRVHLANERTFLAWIRTSVAIMAFGMVVDKASLFFQDYMSRHGHEHLPGSWMSEVIGICIVLMGCITGLLAAVRYLRTQRDIERGHFRPSIILDLLFTAVFITLAAFFVLHLLNTQLVILTN